MQFTYVDLHTLKNDKGAATAETPVCYRQLRPEIAVRTAALTEGVVEAAALRCKTLQVLTHTQPSHAACDALSRILSLSLTPLLQK